MLKQSYKENKMASDFLKKNFSSMNMSDEEKEKMNKKIKQLSGAAVSEAELKFLKKALPGSMTSVIGLKKLLEEDK
tara:strand:+ start:363 stop:590 length:228 start_codon:yes stop_codon:yes gene_type:complete